MNVSDAKKVVKAASIANDTVIIEGVHGLGKSAIVKEYAKAEGLHIEELFLSMMEPGDMLGIPRTIHANGSTVTSWSEPTWFRRIKDAAWPNELITTELSFINKNFEDKYAKEITKEPTISRDALNNYYCEFKGIFSGELELHKQCDCITYNKSQASVLFLDELNRSTLDTRNASMQLILEKELNDHILPYVNGRQTQIVAAINPADQYQVDELDPALLDRFLHIEVEADAKAFLAWGRANGLNDIVLSYIAENPNKLHFQPEEGSKDNIGASPRSWAKLASFVDVMDKIPAEIHFSIIKGKIGSALGSRFLTYMNNYSKTLKIEDIEKVIKKEMKTKSIEEVGKAVNKLIENQEVIQKTEMAENFFAKYINSKKSEDAYPLLAYLYGLDLELRASFIKQKKEDDMKTYTKFVGFDKDLNNKQLFLSIVQTIK